MGEHLVVRKDIHKVLSSHPAFSDIVPLEIVGFLISHEPLDNHQWIDSLDLLGLLKGKYTFNTNCELELINSI